MSSTKFRSWRRAVSVLLVLCLVVTLLPMNNAVKAATNTETVFHEDFLDGQSDAVQSGGADLSIVDKDYAGKVDGKSLYVSSRENDYDAADFYFNKLNMVEGTTYTITIKGYVEPGAYTTVEGKQPAIQVQPVDPQYGWVGSTPITAEGGSFTISGTYTVDTAEHNRLRIQSNADAAAVPFYVDDILITTEKTVTTKEIFHEDFLDGQSDAVQSGGAELSIVDKDYAGKVDGKSLYVSSRENDYDAADFYFNKLNMVEGTTYTITIKGYVEPGAYTTVEGKQPAIQVQPVDPQYGWVGSTPITAEGGSFTISGTYTVDTAEHNRLRIQSNADAAAVPFYIDDILVTTEGTVTPPPTTPTLKEIYHETFKDGVGKVKSAGNTVSLTTEAGITFDGNDDGYALLVSNRQDSWNGADLPIADLGLADGKVYNVTIKGKAIDLPTGSKITLQNANTYSWYNEASVTTGGAFTLSGTYTADTANDKFLRIQSDDAAKAVSFYIGDILITTEETTTNPPEEKPAKPFETITFDKDNLGDKAGFVGRGGVETLTVTNEANHTEGGTYSLKIEGRTQNWNGPSLNIVDYVNSYGKYEFEVWVRMASPDSGSLTLSTQVGDSSYNNIQTVTATSGEWTQIKKEFTYKSLSSGKVTLYVESTSADASFYIDDISIKKVETAPIVIQDLEPIKDVYANDFLFGNAVAPSELEGPSFELLKKHFNVITAGNEMKPENLQRTKGTYSFAVADGMIKKAKDNNMKVHGHVLVWHAQTPAWMNTTTGGIALSRDEALENMTEHVTTVVKHFGDGVISWDVVNEAFADNPSNPTDWRNALRKDSNWTKSIGPDFIEEAFLAARKALDEMNLSDIKLYYNDYNEDNQNKATAIYSMVKELNDKYALTHPGKLLIDGVGMQAHYNLSTNPENVLKSLEKFISLGVEVSITELDIMAGSKGKQTDEQIKAQAYLYAQLMKIFKEHSANIPRVTIWGLDDGTSWRSEYSPVIFTAELQAKPSYYAVINPDKYMAENEAPGLIVTKQAAAAYGKPVVDGTVDSIWSQAEELAVDRLSGAWNYASGKAKVLWDDKNLYVLVEVGDTLLNKDNTNPWEQDSVEVFIDENNGKTTSYEDDDGQYRVNYENEKSFNPASIAEGFESATKVTGTNYTVEMKIPFKKVTPVNNSIIGFDVQINDANASKVRVGTANWNDTTGAGYQDTSSYGEIKLAGKGGSTPTPPPAPPASKPEAKVEKSNITVSIPVTVTNGIATVNITDEVVGNILKNIAEAKKSGENPVVTLKLDTTGSVNAATLALPANSLASILAADKDVSLKIESTLCNLAFDSNTIQTIMNAGKGNIEIKVAQVPAADVAKLPAAAAAKIADRPVFEFTVSNGATVVSNFNGNVTASIPYTPAKDEDTNAVVAYWIDGNNLVPVRGTFHNGNVEFTTTHFSKFAVGYNKVSFSDVKTSNTYYAAATYLGARDVITGSTLQPNSALTRGDAIVMLLKAYNIKPSTDLKNNFSDAKGENAGYYAKAKEIGITSGIGNNKLAPNTKVTREMLYTMINNLASYLGENSATNVKEFKGFKDSDKLSNWSLAAVKKLVEAGMMKDNAAVQLNPKTVCNRGEFVKVLYSLLTKNSVN